VGDTSNMFMDALGEQEQEDLLNNLLEYVQHNSPPPTNPSSPKSEEEESSTTGFYNLEIKEEPMDKIVEEEEEESEMMVNTGDEQIKEEEEEEDPLSSSLDEYPSSLDEFLLSNVNMKGCSMASATAGLEDFMGLLDPRENGEVEIEFNAEELENFDLQSATRSSCDRLIKKDTSKGRKKRKSRTQTRQFEEQDSEIEITIKREDFEDYLEQLEQEYKDGSGDEEQMVEEEEEEEEEYEEEDEEDEESEEEMVRQSQEQMDQEAAARKKEDLKRRAELYLPLLDPDQDLKHDCMWNGFCCSQESDDVMLGGSSGRRRADSMGSNSGLFDDQMDSFFKSNTSFEVFDSLLSNTNGYNSACLSSVTCVSPTFGAKKRKRSSKVSIFFCVFIDYSFNE